MVDRLKRLNIFEDRVHGKSGNMNIETSNFGRLDYEWEQAGKDLGYKIMDPNGFQEEGNDRVSVRIPSELLLLFIID